MVLSSHPAVSFSFSFEENEKKLIRSDPEESDLSLEDFFLSLLRTVHHATFTPPSNQENFTHCAT